MDNGVVIGKTLKEIKKGEQLYVSYKAHYTHHVKVERQRFLKRFDINCKCDFCKMDNNQEPTVSIFFIKFKYDDSVNIF